MRAALTLLSEAEDAFLATVTGVPKKHYPSKHMIRRETCVRYAPNLSNSFGPPCEDEQIGGLKFRRQQAVGPRTLRHTVSCLVYQSQPS